LTWPAAVLAPAIALRAAPLAAIAAAPASRTPTVAVLYFDYQGKHEELAVLKTGLAQMLISDLGAGEAWRIVERAQLQALLDEQKLGQSGQVDRATAARVGKLLGAQLMVLGSFFELGPTLRVDARLVDVETGRIVHTIGVNGKADDFLEVERKISADLEQSLVNEAAKRPVSSPVAPSVPRHPRPTPPAHLKSTTAVKYSQALASADKGDRRAARATLQNVLTEQPDFALARADLERLMQ